METHDLKGAAPLDLDIFMNALIKNLMAKGFDPTAHHTGIHICAQQDGLKTMTGKPAVIPLGCNHYNPYQDRASFEPPDNG
ncbi:hypothetical protein C6T65_10135 [Burkholderia vietnamiensis]|uniref:Uncharacterized protein n=2 Tax=Burkholderia vietnamiensis TaxID=60552 RepID=A0AA44Y1A1_BURVI|nr:hypothetical protein C6T65_10135 [Burkholderia vietnamiensis]